MVRAKADGWQKEMDVGPTLPCPLRPSLGPCARVRNPPNIHQSERGKGTAHSQRGTRGSHQVARSQGLATAGKTAVEDEVG